jgi:LacI family transcriptional regulator
MNGRIAVASLSLGTGFPGTIFSLLKRQLLPGDQLVECSMVLEKTPEYTRTRLLGLLDASVRPTALIGICLRPDPATVAAYRAAGVPIVLVDEETDGVSTVASDNFAGGLLAARHLVQAGRRAMGVVCGLRHLDGGYNALQRVSGFEKGLAEAGLALAPGRLVEVMNYSRKDGMDAMAKLLDGGGELDAVFCAAGDLCADGMLASARTRGVHVPDQLALVGYDDHPVSATTSPPLSTVRQPLERIAHAAYQLAAADAREIFARPRKVILEPDLIARASTERAAASAPTPAPFRSADLAC